MEIRSRVPKTLSERVFLNKFISPPLVLSRNRSVSGVAGSRLPVFVVYLITYFKTWSGAGPPGLEAGLVEKFCNLDAQHIINGYTDLRNETNIYDLSRCKTQKGQTETQNQLRTKRSKESEIQRNGELLLIVTQERIVVNGHGRNEFIDQVCGE